MKFTKPTYTTFKLNYDEIDVIDEALNLLGYLQNQMEEEDVKTLFHNEGEVNYSQIQTVLDILEELKKCDSAE